MGSAALGLVLLVGVLVLVGYGPKVVRELRDALADRRRRRMQLNRLESLAWGMDPDLDAAYLEIMRQEVLHDARWASACERGGLRLLEQRKGTAGRW